MNLTNLDPEVVFKPERRRKEYIFLNQQIDEINKREDLSIEDKRFMKGKLKEYYNEFDEQYTEYYRIVRENNMWNALRKLNKRMNWN